MNTKLCRPLLLLSLLVFASCSSSQGTIAGSVHDENGPVAGAIVRVQTSKSFTTTDADGGFTLTGIRHLEPVTLTAWASGYYIVGEEAVMPGTRNVEIILHAHHDTDNPNYVWLPSTYHPGQGENQGCAECHSQEGTEITFPLPVDEWSMDAHALSATNPRFLTMYTGRDVNGNQSPQTRFGSSRDYGSFPLGPDPNQLYFGPGYKLDFPETAGNCAACHTPATAVNDPYGIDLSYVSETPMEGIPCDFCHKIWDVKLDQSGLPYPNMPGVLSYEFRRPPDGHQFFAGPYDDVAPGEDTYSPLQQQSQFCAPCHFGAFWDTVIYNSFGEWLESPYSDPETGKTCQDCHMPPSGATQFARSDQGGLTRDPESIFSHLMPGASDEELLQNAVSMSIEAWRVNREILLQVDITNNNTGHHIPTDSPLRHMILLVQVLDSEGNRLVQLSGPTVPDWGGVGEFSDGHYAGHPGTAYAKVLQEAWTGIYPTGAYWNPTRILNDNRIPAFETDRTTYRFSAPQEGQVTIEVKLLFRRAFIELMEQKGWDAPDILMSQETTVLD